MLFGWVKSSVTVGHVAFWEKVATAVLGEIVDGDEEKRGEFERVVVQCELVIEPERNMFSAADVELAKGLAAGGSGWLWFPS